MRPWFITTTRSASEIMLTRWVIMNVVRPLANCCSTSKRVAFRGDHVGNAAYLSGSIAYTAALSHDGYENNIARLTGNVLRRFREPESLFVLDP